MQVLAVGQHRVRLGAEEVVVPDVEHALDRREVLLQRRRAEVLVHRVEARRASRRRLRCRWRSSARSRWPSRRSSARRPSPRSRTCCRCRCRTPATCLGVGRHRDEVLGDRARPSRRRGPRAASRARRRVGQRLQGGERLGADHEQRRGRVEVVQGLRRRRSGRCWRRSGIVTTGSRVGRSASYAMTGPRSEPPMPMLTTAVIRSPVCARPLAGADALGELAHLGAARAWTSAGRPGRRREGELPAAPAARVCRTARSSVVLMCSPANIASRCASTQAARRATAMSSGMVSSVIRCFE